MANMAAEVAASMARIKALQAALTRPKFDEEEESEEAEMARQFAEQEAGWEGWTDESAAANTAASEPAPAATTDTATAAAAASSSNIAKTGGTVSTTHSAAAADAVAAPTHTAQPTDTTTTHEAAADSTAPITHRTASSIITGSIQDKENTDLNASTGDINTSLTSTRHHRTYSKPAGYSTLQPIAEWSNEQCIQWLDTIKAKLLSYQHIFVNKGWSEADIHQWNDSIDTQFVSYVQHWTQQKIDGTVLNSADDSTLQDKCAISEQYHRALMLSNLRQYKRKTITRQ